MRLGCISATIQRMPNPQNIVKHKFKKGQSGNPNGRPKMPDLSEAVAKVLNKEKDGVKAIDAILMKLHEMALDGNVKAIELLLDRGFGKVRQDVDLTSNGETLAPAPITWRIRDAEDVQPLPEPPKQLSE